MKITVTFTCDDEVAAARVLDDLATTIKVAGKISGVYDIADGSEDGRIIGTLLAQNLEPSS